MIFSNTSTYWSDNMFHIPKGQPSVACCSLTSALLLKHLEPYSAGKQQRLNIFEQWDVSKWHLHLRSIWPRCIAMVYAL